MRRRTLDFWSLANLAGAMVNLKFALENSSSDHCYSRGGFGEGAVRDRSFVDKAARAYIGHDLGLYDATIREVLDPLRAVQARTLIGGAGPFRGEKTDRWLFCRA